VPPLGDRGDGVWITLTKNGKTHRYFSVVENRRTGTGTTQRQVLYLGEINDSQQEAWRRTLRVFDEDRHQYCELSLKPIALSPIPSRTC
jgi:hypothetical protein